MFLKGLKKDENGRGRRKNISVRYAAALSLFMTGNAVSVRKRFKAGKVETG